MMPLIRVLTILIGLGHLAAVAQLVLRSNALFRQFDKFEAAYLPWLILAHCVAVLSAWLVARRMPGGMSVLALSTMVTLSLDLSSEFPLHWALLGPAAVVALAVAIAVQERREA